MYVKPSTTSLNYGIQPGLPQEVIITYKLDTVHLEVFFFFKVLDDVPLIHPLRNKAQPIFGDRCTKEG
jgi:hypothetical protein